MTAVADRSRRKRRWTRRPIQVRGKFFFAGETKFFVKGVTYGPFGPGSHGAQFPERDMVERDFALMRELGVNTVRVFTVPPLWLLDLALRWRACGSWSACPGRSTSTFLDDAADPARDRRAVRRGGARPGPAPGGLRLSHRQRDPARHGALARRRAGARVPEAPRRHGEGGRSRAPGQLRQLSVDRISHRRFHRFPLLQRLSARRGARSAAISRGCTISRWTGRWC